MPLRPRLAAFGLPLALSLVGCAGAVESPLLTDTPSPAPSPAPAPSSAPAPAPLRTVPEPLAKNNDWKWGEARGCDDFTVYTSDPTGRMFLVVTGDTDELLAHANHIETGEQVTVKLDSGRAYGIEVAVDTYPEPVARPAYCSDTVVDGQLPYRSHVTTGEAIVVIKKAPTGKPYIVGVTVVNAYYKGKSGGTEVLHASLYEPSGQGGVLVGPTR